MHSPEWPDSGWAADILDHQAIQRRAEAAEVWTRTTKLALVDPPEAEPDRRDGDIDAELFELFGWKELDG